MKKLSLILPLILLLTASYASDTTGSSCNVDDDCPDLYECTLSSSGAGTCTKNNLFPISAREVVGTFVFTGLNALLTAGGVGAGAAYVPYIILLFQTTLSHSIYIAYLCVFGGGLGNLVNIIRLKNPKTNRYMTNYNLNMIILPALMIGVMIGMILQRIFPPLVTHLLLLMTLAYSLIKNYGKLKYNLAKERKERHEKKEALKTEEMAQINAPTEPENNVLPTEPSAPPKEQAKEPVQEPVKEPVTELPKEPAKESDCKLALPSSTPDKNEDVTVMTSVPEKTSSKAFNKVMKPSDINLAQLQIEIDKASDNDRLAEKRRLIYEREQKFPWRKIREILVNIVVIVVIGLIRGSSSFKPVVGVDWSCGWDFLWFALAIVAYGAVLARCLYLVLKDQKEKLEVGYEFLPEEPFMDTPKIVRLVIVATIAGTIGAIVALGGSMIVGPTLLDFKMPPAFSSATTGLFMIFAMFNTTFGAILNQKVSGQELAWFLPLSFVCSYLSSKLVSWYIRKTGKQSVVIKCIMLVAALGFVCLLAIMIRDLVQDTKAQITFNGVC